MCSCACACLCVCVCDAGSPVTETTPQWCWALAEPAAAPLVGLISDLSSGDNSRASRAGLAVVLIHFDFIIYLHLQSWVLLNCSVSNYFDFQKAFPPNFSSYWLCVKFISNDQQQTGHGRETKAGRFEAGKQRKGEVVTLFFCQSAQQQEFKDSIQFNNLFYRFYLCE